MPTYTYRCDHGHEFEEVHSMAEHVNATVCQCGRYAKQVIDLPGRAIGVEERSDTRYWRDAPTKVFMNDKRKRKL